MGRWRGSGSALVVSSWQDAAMPRSFNVTGPCFADEHYMVPPERRLERTIELVQAGKYFTFTGGRQTGKTTNNTSYQGWSRRRTSTA